MPVISLPIYGAEHPYRIIVLVQQFRCHDTSRLKVLRLVITPINCEEEEGEDSSVFVSSRKPKRENRDITLCARIINVNRCSHRCCDPFRGRGDIVGWGRDVNDFETGDDQKSLLSFLSFFLFNQRNTGFEAAYIVTYI